MRDAESALELESVGPSAESSGMMEAAVAAAAAASPRIHHLNVSQKSHMHIGPKFVTVTQNVRNVEVVKALGLELEAGGEETAGSGVRRVRCGVAVFVCWALVVTAALAAGLLCALLLRGPDLIDLGVGVCGWVAAWVRRSSRAERTACAGALLGLVTCGALLAATLGRRAAVSEPPDVAPHAWNITRAMWLARSGPVAPPLDAAFIPPRLVIVQHTAGPECHRFDACAATMRHLQDWYITDYLTDIPYNFLIGNEGRAYEGRGWDLHGAHTLGFNRCSVGLGFVGDYRSSVGGSRPSEAQLAVARRLLAGGVARGTLHARFRVVGANELQATVSPGETLVDALRAWPEYAREAHRFFNTSCEYVYSLLQAEDDPPEASVPVL